MDCSYKKALQYAYKLLSYRGRSEKELSKRLLTKGYETQIVGDIVNKLKLSGLLDDNSLASSLKRYAGETKLLGIEGTRRFLMERDIPSEIIRETLSGLDETEAAKRLVAKRLLSMRKITPLDGRLLSSEIAVKKIYGMLMRKGFSYETIKKTIEGLRASLNEKC